MTHDNPRTKNALNLIAACAAVVACARDEAEHMRKDQANPVPGDDAPIALRADLSALMLNAEHIARTFIGRVREGRAS